MDNLRWLAMLWGVFVHTATLGDFGPITLVQESSNLFRMALFFMISGFLGSLLLQRQGRAKFWSGRFRNLLVPLVFGILVLNPPTLWLVYAHSHGGEASWPSVWSELVDGAPGEGSNFTWHLHLWFLGSLAFYVLVAPFALAVIRLIAIFLDERLAAQRFWQPMAPWISVAVIAGASVLPRVGIEGLELVTGPVPWIVRVTAVYLPYYLFGMLLYLSPGLQATVLRPSWGLGLAVIAFFTASKIFEFGNLTMSAVDAFALAAMRAWLAITLIFLGQRWIAGHNGMTDLFSRAIYTVYLLHYGLIYLAAYVLEDRVSFQSPFTYFGIALMVTILGLAVHSAVVTRSSLLTLLLNGRLSRPGSAA